MDKGEWSLFFAVGYIGENLLAYHVCALPGGTVLPGAPFVTESRWRVSTLMSANSGNYSLCVCTCSLNLVIDVSNSCE